MARKLSKTARKKQIIENLEHTISMGGNQLNIETLKKILEEVKTDTSLKFDKPKTPKKV